MARSPSSDGDRRSSSPRRHQLFPKSSDFSLHFLAGEHILSLSGRLVRLPHRRRPDRDTARGVRFIPAVKARCVPIPDRHTAGSFYALRPNLGDFFPLVQLSSSFPAHKSQRIGHPRCGARFLDIAGPTHYVGTCLPRSPHRHGLSVDAMHSSASTVTRYHARHAGLLSIINPLEVCHGQS